MVAWPSLAWCCVNQNIPKIIVDSLKLLNSSLILMGSGNVI